MSDEEKKEVVSTELELDGKIFLVGKDEKGDVVSRDQLDGELCLKVVVAVLDDALKHPYLDKLFQRTKNL